MMVSSKKTRRFVTAPTLAPDGALYFKSTTSSQVATSYGAMVLPLRSASWLAKRLQVILRRSGLSLWKEAHVHPRGSETASVLRRHIRKTKK